MTFTAVASEVEKRSHRKGAAKDAAKMDTAVTEKPMSQIAQTAKGYMRNATSSRQGGVMTTGKRTDAFHKKQGQTTLRHGKCKANHDM